MPYAMHIPRPGGPEVFERVNVARPAPGPGQLLVRVAAVGVNFIETYQRAGIYAVDYPFCSRSGGRRSHRGDRRRRDRLLRR